MMRLPGGDERRLIALDLERARRALKMPSRALPPPPRPGSRPTRAQRQLGFGLAVAAPALQPSRGAAVAEAIDLRSATAIATATDGESVVTLIATDQPFGEVAAKLEARGFEDSGGVLEGGLSPDVVGYSQVAAIPGAIVLASSRELLDGARAGEGGTVVAEAATALGEPVVVAAPLPACDGAVALADALDPPRGRLVVRAEGADPERVVLARPGGLQPSTPGDLAVRPARRIDGTLVAAFGYRLGARSSSPLGALASGVPSAALYRCG